jgi:DNA-binding transcriptional ArsR family regulator
MLSLERPEDRKVVDSLLGVERLEIIRILSKPQPMYLTEIAKESKMDRTTLAYHLGVLERAGMIKSEYRILLDAKAKGKAARFYSLNIPKLSEALNEVKGLLPAQRLLAHLSSQNSR